MKKKLALKGLALWKKYDTNKINDDTFRKGIMPIKRALGIFPTQDALREILWS